MLGQDDERSEPQDGNDAHKPTDGENDQESDLLLFGNLQSPDTPNW
jgi:hypothetical protein